MNLRLSTLMFLLSLAGAQTGSCFYNPQPGRWINRDPINELEEPLYGSGSQATNEENQLYVFVGNAPIRTVDYLGLAGQVCVQGCCSAAALANFRYIPETACRLEPLRPGQCYDADALYLPGYAIKVNGVGTITIYCGRDGTYRQWGATPFTTTIWPAGTPQPPPSYNGWPCGGDINPDFPPYTTNPPGQN